MSRAVRILPWCSPAAGRTGEPMPLIHAIAHPEGDVPRRGVADARRPPRLRRARSGPARPVAVPRRRTDAHALPAGADPGAARLLRLQLVRLRRPGRQHRPRRHRAGNGPPRRVPRLRPRCVPGAARPRRAARLQPGRRDGVPARVQRPRSLGRPRRAEHALPRRPRRRAAPRMPSAGCRSSSSTARRTRPPPSRADRPRATPCASSASRPTTASTRWATRSARRAPATSRRGSGGVLLDEQG